METLDVVRIHEQALASLAAPDGSSGNAQKPTERAKAFFAEAIVPIEKTHRAARKTDARVNRLTRELRRRTREASAGRRQLARDVVRRQAAEAALKRSAEHRAKLLTEAQRLQAQLRRLTHEILAAQEGERRRTSRRLHDDVAQALLAIDVRLLTLGTSARASTRDLKKEIAETQRLVKQSVKTVRRLSHGCEDEHET